MPLRLWLALAVVATAASAVVWVGFAVHSVPGGDNKIYIAMARAPWVPAIPPWGFRVLGPALVWLAVHATGLPPETLFPVVNFALNAAAMVVLGACAWQLGFRGPMVLLPVVLTAPTYAGMFYLWQGHFPEPALTVCMAFALLFLLQRRTVAFGVTLVLGVLARETALLWIPCYYLATARSIADRRALARTAVVGAIPTAVFLLQILRASTNLEPGFNEPLQWFRTLPWRDLAYLLAYDTFYAFSVLPLLILWRWRELPRELKAALAFVPLNYLQFPLGYDWLRYLVIAHPIVVVASLYGWRASGGWAAVLLPLYVVTSYMEDWLFIQTYAYRALSQAGVTMLWRKVILLVTIAGCAALVVGAALRRTGGAMAPVDRSA